MEGPVVHLKPASRSSVGAEPTSSFPSEASSVTNVSMSNISHDVELEAIGLEEVKGRSTVKIVIIMANLCLSLFLAALDFTIVATALPKITEHFHSAAGYTWIGSAYLLAMAATSPIWGKISDIWGRKPILLLAVFVFFVGSLLCGVASSMIMLIAGRAVQGSAAGGVVILVNVCVSDMFSMRTRGAFLGLTGGVWALASAFGPLLGGAFAEYVSWRWCFYINLPLSGLAFINLFFFLDVKTAKTSLSTGFRAIDWLGSLAILGMTLMFLLGLDFGGVVFPWSSATVICLIVFGLSLSVVFWYTEKNIARYPIIPLGVFFSRSTFAVLLVTFCHGFTYIATSYFLPLYFQSVFEASPLRSGLLLIPIATMQDIVLLATGVFVQKTGRYLEPLWLGMAIMTLGIGLFINLNSTSSIAQVIIFQIVAGIGIGPGLQAPLIALQALVSPQDLATSTATLGFIRNLATSMSVVIGGVVFQNGMHSKESLLTAAGLDHKLVKAFGDSAGANVELVGTLVGTQKEAVKQAFAKSLQMMWILYAGTAALGLLASFFISKKVLTTVHQETKVGLDNEEDRPIVAGREAVGGA